MTIVMPASYHHSMEARKQMWQVSDWDLKEATEMAAKQDEVCVYDSPWGGFKPEKTIMWSASKIVE